MKRINLESLVDITGGPVDMLKLDDEVRDLVYRRYPDKIIITVEQRPELKKYYATIYISKEAFKRYKR